MFSRHFLLSELGAGILSLTACGGDEALSPLSQAPGQEAANELTWVPANAPIRKAYWRNARTAPLQERYYAEVDGQAVFEGDILLGPVHEVEARSKAALQGDVSAQAVSGMGMTSTGSSYLWPNNLVPYTIDLALGSTYRVTDAIAHWEANTPLRFVQLNSTNQGFFPHYVTFRPSTGCSSSLGRQGGQQFINLASGCSTGNTIHEIGHAVGLWHEHTREDRDSFVTINWSNIQSGMETNFYQYPGNSDDRGAYDHGSVMHYPATAFAINPSVNTITPLNGAAIGQRNGLSAGDIAAVKALYGFSWKQGTASVNMGPTSDRFCFLTAMSGFFYGGGEYVSISQSNGAWYLGGGSLQYDVSGGAGCVASSRLTTEYSWSQGSQPAAMGSTTGRVCFLTYVSGHFEGGGESVHVYASNGTWYLGGTSMQAGVSARARCVAVSQYTSEYAWEQGSSPIPMEWAGQHSCALTRVQGKFKGGGESVKAYVEGGRWKLGGSSMQMEVGGRARCFQP